MPFRVKQKVEGVEDIIKSLNILKQGVRNRVVRKGLNEPAKLLVKEVKTRIPKRSGLTRKSIGRKAKTYKSGVVVVIIGPRKGFRKEVVVNKQTGATRIHDPVNIWHLIELGTSHSAAIAPARRAYDANKSVLKSMARQGIIDALATEIVKAAAKGKKITK